MFTLRPLPCECAPPLARGQGSLARSPIPIIRPAGCASELPGPGCEATDCTPSAPSFVVKKTRTQRTLSRYKGVKKERKRTAQTRDGRRTGSPPARAGFGVGEERKQKIQTPDDPRAAPVRLPARIHGAPPRSDWVSLCIVQPIGLRATQHTSTWSTWSAVGNLTSRAGELTSIFLLITADFGHNFHIIAERTRAQKVAGRA